MFARSVVMLMIGLLWATPSAALYARHLTLVVQQQTGRELSETSGNGNSSEEERSESESVVPLRRASLELQQFSRLIRCRTGVIRPAYSRARTHHEARLGEHSARNGCGVPLTC